MTTSTSTKIKDVLHIRLKGHLGYPYVESAEGPDEDGITWHTWYLEKNTDSYTQVMTIHNFMRGIILYDIHIDEDVEEEVCDLSLLKLVEGSL